MLSRTHVNSSKVTIQHECVGKIAALLQAFGLGVGLWGLGNVLQCGVGFLSFFCGGRKKTK